MSTMPENSIEPPTEDLFNKVYGKIPEWVRDYSQTVSVIVHAISSFPVWNIQDRIWWTKTLIIEETSQATTISINDQKIAWVMRAERKLVINLTR
jgi:hypothetical protein